MGKGKKGKYLRSALCLLLSGMVIIGTIRQPMAAEITGEIPPAPETLEIPEPEEVPEVSVPEVLEAKKTEEIQQAEEPTEVIESEEPMEVIESEEPAADQEQISEEEILKASISTRTINVVFKEDGASHSGTPAYTDLRSAQVRISVSDTQAGPYSVVDTATLVYTNSWYGFYDRDDSKYYKFELLTTVPEGYQLSYVSTTAAFYQNIIPPNNVNMSSGDFSFVMTYGENNGGGDEEKDIMGIMQKTTGTVKTNYVAGESFDPTGLTFTLTYVDNTTKEVPHNQIRSRPDPLTAGKYNVILTYIDQEGNPRYDINDDPVACIYPNVTVEEGSGQTKTLDNITIAQPPAKTSYITGQNFNPAGMKIKAHYSDGSDAEVMDYSYTPTGALSVANTAITVSYSEGGVTKTVNQAITVAAKAIESLKLEGTAAKLTYTEGEIFDPAGLTLKAVYNDGSEETITSAQYNIIPPTLSAGDSSVTFSYSGKMVTYSGITVTAAALTKIEVTTPPAKVSYTEGDSFDPAGMVITATYSNNNTEVVTADQYTIIPNRPLLTSDTQMTISYTAGMVTKTASVNITVEAQEAQLTGISVTANPDKLSYVAGQTLDLTGMVVTADYSDGSNADVTGQCDMIPAAGTVLTISDTVIAISYTQGGITKTTSLNIQISEKVITGIRVEGTADTVTYTEGDSFDPAGLTVYADYNNGSATIITSGYTILPDRLNAGDTLVTFKYNEHTADYGPIAVTPVPVTLASIYVDEEPQTTYIEGQNFDPAGMVVKAVYSDNSETDVTLGCSYNPTGALSITDTQIIISYQDKTTALPITVAPKQLTGITIEGNAVKTVYVEGESFDPTGLIVAAQYDNGESITLSSSDYRITPSSLTTETTSVTFEYNGMTETYGSILVNPVSVVLEDLYIDDEPDKTSYIEGESFEIGGMKIIAVYSNDSEADVTGSCNYSPNGALSQSDSVITFTYTAGGVTKTVTQAITVSEKEVIQLVIEGTADKLIYTAGEAFDPAGLTVKAIYNNGSETILSSLDYEITPEMLSISDTGVTISYAGKTVAYTGITVNPEPVEAQLTAIEITTAPNKVSYVEGQSLDLTGMIVTAKYDDDTTAEVTSSCTMNPAAGSTLAVSDTEIVISYIEDGITKTVSQPISVAEKVITGIHLEGTAVKVTYTAGESFDPAGLALCADYNDDSFEEIASGYSIANDPLEEGDTSVTFSYNGHTTSYGPIMVTAVPVTLESIYIETEPDKTAYEEGEVFDPTGMVVTAVYSDNSEVDVTAGCSYDPSGALSLSDTGIVITYGDKTTTQAITVNAAAAELTGIHLEGVAVKTNYLAGESFDPAGLTLYADYNDGTSEVLNSSYSITNDPLAEGDTFVTFAYLGYTVSYGPITVDAVPAAQLTGIEVTAEPDTISYIAGQTLDLTGMVVTASYDDETTADITNQCSTVPSNGSVLEVSNADVQISYTEEGITKTTSQPISVAAKVITGIHLEGSAVKVTYTAGESFDSTGLTLYADYNDGTFVVIDSEYSIANDPLEAGDTSVTFTYGQHSVSYGPIIVTAELVTLESIYIEAEPDKTSYQEGEIFDPSGMIVKAVYSDDSELDVTAGCSYEPAGALSAGDTEITITYGNKTTIQEITVNAATAVQLTGIEVTVEPDNVSYVAGALLDLTGMVVTASYDDGTTADVTNLCTMIPPAGSSLAVNDTQVAISYTQAGVTKTTSQPIEVAARTMSGIHLEGTAARVTYYAGESFEPDGLTLYADYNDGVSVVVSSGYSIVNDPLEAEDTSVTFTYQGHSAFYGPIIVTSYPADKELTRIRLEGSALKKIYQTGEAFEPEGLTVYAVYDDESEEEIALADCEMAPALLARDTKAVTISYEGYSVDYDDFEITDSSTEDGKKKVNTDGKGKTGAGKSGSNNEAGKPVQTGDNQAAPIYMLMLLLGAGTIGLYVKGRRKSKTA